MKKLTRFFPLHPVPIYGQEHEKQKKPGSRWSRYQSFICKTCLEKFLSLVWPTKSGNCGKEMKKVAKYSTSQEWKELFRGSKNHFSLFWNAFFLQNIKK